MCGDERKEDLKSYYKLTKEYMEEITKEWPTEFLVPVGDEKIFDPDLIGSPLVTTAEWDGPSNAKKRKKKKEFQDINNTSEENVPD
jgi:hypothetical protein